MSIEDGCNDYDRGYANGLREGSAGTVRAAERTATLQSRLTSANAEIMARDKRISALEDELAEARETIESLRRQVPEPWYRPEER